MLCLRRGEGGPARRSRGGCPLSGRPAAPQGLQEGTDLDPERRRWTRTPSPKSGRSPEGCCLGGGPALRGPPCRRPRRTAGARLRGQEVASIELPAKLRKLNDNAHLVSSTELPANLRNLNDDVAAVFDEILVQEILDPNKSTFLEIQRPLAKSAMTTTKEKKSRVETNYRTDAKTTKYEVQFPAEKENRLFVNEEDREILYQIKSLAALERIIESLQRALGNSLEERRKKNKNVFKGGRHYKGKQSLN
uniref:Uncharacterized protein n=1 Tax=Sus scrofa TaxID=9823 RepID=A0A8D0VHQ1_PIG